MHPFLINALGFAGVIVLLAYAWGTFKRSKLDVLVTVTKETENGETLCFNTNFSSDATEEEKTTKVDGLIAIAERRMFAAQAKMVEAMEKARAEKQQLKKVT